MTGGSTWGTVLFAAIPVTAMLVIEVVLPYLKKRRRDVPSRQNESDQTRRDVAFTGEDVDTTVRRVEEVAHEASVPSDAAGHRVDGERTAKRWRQNGHYYQVLHQTAHAGSLASMNKLGELALVRKDFVEAFYWKLMMELRHGKPSGLSARGVCRAWRGAGCPKPNADEDGLFTESQAKLSMAVLNLWSGLHVHTPTEAIRQMVNDGQADAILFERRFGYKGA